MELFKASNQWMTRPADERFWTVAEMEQVCRTYADQARNAMIRYGDLRVEAREGDLVLVGKADIPAKLTHYAMGQVCSRLKAPASYLRTLSPTLAAQNLNHGLKHQRDPDDQANMLVHMNGGYLARCFVGKDYKRIWNWEIAKRLVGLEADGWRVAPARPAGIDGERTRIATEADCLRGGRGIGGLSIKPGDTIAPAGLYASDRDCFAFLIDDNHTIANPLSPDSPLARGFMIWNSEVGDKSFGLLTFLYDAVCGNHIVWGAQDVQEIRVRHVGQARNRAFRQVGIELRRYANSSVSEDEAKLQAAATYQIGASRDEVLDTLFKYVGKRRIDLSRGALTAAYDTADDNPRYNPRTPLGIVSGLTENNQHTTHAERRVKLDQAAGKLLEIAF